ncbi:MAG: response regulator transcription factor [Acidimicrobiales bacterium]|nr:response regulator transcription factor [Acidimicrobiales bacterium]
MSEPAGDIPHIVVVEDDMAIAEVVVRYLEQESFRVDSYGHGGEALDALLAEPPDLLVLDLMLPGIDGIELFRRLRALAPVPVMMLTARGEETDKVIGLEMGADDYLTKPFSPRELVARVKAVLRRVQGALETVEAGSSPVLTAGDLEVDVVAREVRRAGRVVSLTAREFELLAFLVRNPKQAFRREELLEKVWGYTFGDTSTVTVHVRRLREKVEADPSEPHHLATVWGVGYRFEP